MLAAVRGTGLEVASGAGERCRGERLKLIRARLRQVLAEARQSHLEARELRDIIQQELKQIEREGA